MQDAPLFVASGFRNPESFVNFVLGVNSAFRDQWINGGVRRGKEILTDGAFNREPGGIEAFVTESGTNDLRGRVFEYVRNDNLDAAGWTNNARNLRKPDCARANLASPSAARCSFRRSTTARTTVCPTRSAG